MEKFVILDVLGGGRHATIKANSKREAHEIYCEGSDFLNRQTFCLSLEEYLNTVKSKN